MATSNQDPLTFPKEAEQQDDQDSHPGEKGNAAASSFSTSAQVLADYDLSKPITSSQGLRSGLTSYGDAHFSLFLRKVFIKALGYSDDACTSS